MASLASCTSDEPAPVPVKAGRTVLVYMAADNNLGSTGFDRADITEMREAADNGRLGNGRLLVYHSSYSKAPVLMEIRRGGIDTLVRYERGVTASSRERMTEVIGQTRRLAPAESYGLVLWGHGTGWIEDGIADTRSGASYSYGPERGKAMNITTLADILEQQRIFDYVYFDCCYMASVETVYQLRNATDYVVGSATELLTTGMPYQLNVPLLVRGDESALVEAARNTFELYDGYSGVNRTCTMSVIRTAGLDRLAEASRALFDTTGGRLPEGYEPQRFMDTTVAGCYYFDFLDYATALAGAVPEAEAQADRLREAFGETVIYAAATPRLWNVVELDRHNGLSTFIARDASDFQTGGYIRLDWYGDVAKSLF